MAGSDGAGRLWEREREHDLLLATLAAARQGKGTILFVRGDPGMGKSRILALAAAEARRDFTVVSAVGEEPEQAYPFALLHQLVESLVRRPETDAAALTHGLDVLRAWFYGRDPDEGTAASVSPGARAAVLYAAYWLLASVAERRPLLLCLDDLQWSDPDSLEAIRFLARRLGDVPVAVLAGLRSWPAGPSALAEALTRDGAAEICDLRALGPAAVAGVLAALLGAAPSARRAEQAIELTGGNPFLVEQLGRVWRAAPDDAPGDGDAALRQWPLRRRLMGVPPQGLRLLQAASVLGRSFRLDIALELAGLQPADEATALAPLRALGLAVPDAHGRWSFVHPLFQHSVYADLGEAERQSLHGQALGRLRTLGAPAADLTPHVLRACRPGDPRALQDLLQAAEDAEAQAAYDSAVFHFEAATGFCPADDPGRAVLYYRVGRAHQRAGDQRAALAAFTAGLRQAGPDLALRVGLQLGCGLSSTFLGDLAEARRNLAGAVQDAAGLAPATAAEACVAQAILLHSFGGWREAAAAVEQAARFADLADDPRPRARAKACRAWVGWATGDPQTYRWAREAAAEMPPAPPNELELAVGLTVPLVHGVTAMLWEHYDEARGPLTEANTLARARRAMPALIWSATFLTDLAWRRGRLREAFAHAAEIPADDLGLPWLTAEPRIHRARVLMDMGDLDGAAACFAKSAAEALATGQTPIRMLATFAQATLAARQGRWDTALSGFAAAGKLAESIEHTGADPFRWRQEAVDALLHVGATEQAAALLEDMAAATRRLDWPGAAAIVLRYRALLSAAHGLPSEADRQFRAAEALHQQAGEALEHGRTLLGHGAWLRRQGDIDGARSILGEAATILAACGAGYWLDRAEAERRAAGGRRRRHPGSGPLARLTPQEYRVAELVSQELTNREIACALLISPKTLESHLGHIYQKIDVASRSALGRHFSDHAAGAAPGTGARTSPARGTRPSG